MGRTGAIGGDLLFDAKIKHGTKNFDRPCFCVEGVTMGEVGEYWRDAKEYQKMVKWRSSMFGEKGTIGRCHHPRCQSQISARLYACPGHWRELPRGIQSQIRNGYKKSPTVWFRGHKNAQEFWNGQQ